MEVPSLLWINNKQSSLRKYKFGLTANSDSYLNIPLQLACLNSNKILNAKVKYMIITDDMIKFDCYNNPGTRTHSTEFVLSFEHISLIEYAVDNSIMKITLLEQFYNRLITNTAKDEPLFHNTIWFCLNIPNIHTYNNMIEVLKNKLKSLLNICEMSSTNLDLFMKIITKKPHSPNFIGNWYDVLTQRNTINCIKSPEKNKSIDKVTISDKTKASIKRRKEEFDMVISSKKASISSSRSNQKYVYCPSPKNSIEISAIDLKCLKPRQYINDNVINLYITYIYYEIMTEEQRQQTHLFNCFFNTKLIGPKKVFTETPFERHQRVAKWTKNVDIFDKDFLIIPVIEDQHWFLVIVCFPWMAGMIDYGTMFNKESIAPSSHIPDNHTPFATTIRKERLAAMKNQCPDYNPMPCILIFDSLSFVKRTGKVNIIRDYLKSEWNAKRLQRDGPLIFDKTTVRGYSPKVPQQDNNTDCGVYLLHYVESFFKNPIKNYSVEFFKTFLTKWFHQSEVGKKRTEIQETIIRVIKKSDINDLMN